MVGLLIISSVLAGIAIVSGILVCIFGFDFSKFKTRLVGIIFVLCLTISVAGFTAPLSTHEDVLRFEKEYTIIVDKISAGEQSEELEESITKYNKWLRWATQSKEKDGIWSFYYFEDLSNFKYIER